MANTDDSKSEFSEDEMASLSESIRSIAPEQLPENGNELSLLHRNVSDAIAFLDNEVSVLKSREKLHNTFEKTLKSTGYEPLVHMPDVEGDESAQSNPVRWDWIAKYLDGGQRLSLMICWKALDEEFSRWSSWLAPLSYTNVVDELVRQLGVQCPTSMSRDEFRERIVRNYSNAAQVQESRKVVLGIEIALLALKKLEDKVVEKLTESEFMLAGWKSPKQWRSIYKKFDDSMSEKTWQRRIKDGTIRIHPSSTSKRVAIHKSSLPFAYLEELNDG